jgi:hypothetical protein
VRSSRTLVGACVATLALVTACSNSSSGASSAPTSPPPAASGTQASASPSVAAQTPVPAESNPPGDIPDNLAFVSYRNAKGGYRFTHPEGWAQRVRGPAVRFTDKLNGVAADVVSATHPTTVASARREDVPRLRSSVPAFELRSVSQVNLPGGRAVRIVFRRNSDPDPVTGRQYRDEVEEYLFWHAGRVLRLDLFGPVGADNVDAYRTMSTSVRFS